MNEDCICNICGDEITETTKHILKCKHIYHYTCLIEDYKAKLNQFGKIKVTDRVCPYCRKKILPLPYKPEFGGHLPTIHASINYKENIYTRCSALCKTGQQCKFKGKYNGRCGHHKLKE